MRVQRTITAVLLTLSAANAARAADPFPLLSVALYNREQCPAGWSPYNNADGRLLVPVPPTFGVGTQAGGTKLAPGAEPQHRHSFAASFAVPDVSYVLIGGCCGRCLGRADTYDITGTTQSQLTSLPYVELFACLKQPDAATAGTVPPGLMTYSLLPFCLPGWREVTSARGRIVVGLRTGGSPGAAFGGPPLGAMENRAHTHPFSGTVTTTNQDIAGAPGCCAGGYAKNGTYPYHGNTHDATADWPYVQLMLCEKS